MRNPLPPPPSQVEMVAPNNIYEQDGQRATVRIQQAVASSISLYRVLTGVNLLRVGVDFGPPIPYHQILSFQHVFHHISVLHDIPVPR